ncbi:MAG TPA: TRAM domain-containing protein, partial [Gemmatimonadales bacterium]|nr:TRAM domain-containing protein [Gemmatimonadales bacterium]
MNEVITVTAVAAGGDGVGRLADGRAVFVPRTAPGERVALKDVRLHKSFARAVAGEIVEPAGTRVTPACGHYVRDHCGGCQLQHLAYDAQLAAKRAIVGDALRRIGKLDLPDPEIVEAVEEWRYRSKITLAVHRKGGLVVGLHPHDHPDAVFQLGDCHITDARLMDLWRGLRQHLDLLPPRATRLALRLDREAGRHIIAELGGTTGGEPWPAAAELLRALGGDGVTCWWRPADGAARVVAGAETGFPAAAFEQVNPDMGVVARRWAVEQLGDIGGRPVWDLYGGIGDTAVLLAGRGAAVV